MLFLGGCSCSKEFSSWCEIYIYEYVLFSDDDAMLLKEIHDVALCVSEAEDMSDSDTDGRFSC